MALVGGLVLGGQDDDVTSEAVPQGVQGRALFTGGGTGSGGFSGGGVGFINGGVAGDAVGSVG
jgi:hypothetical protein